MALLDEQLPESYTYANPSTVTAAEVIELRDASGWGTERNKILWQSVIEDSIATVGVRDENETLIGVGFLAGNARHAVLCDFVVRPDKRGMGIGKAILNRRMNIAESMDIPYLYTELAPTNKLRSLYEDLGFVATGRAYTRAARRHPSELAEV